MIWLDAASECKNIEERNATFTFDYSLAVQPSHQPMRPVHLTTRWRCSLHIHRWKAVRVLFSPFGIRFGPRIYLCMSSSNESCVYPPAQPLGHASTVCPFAEQTAKGDQEQTARAAQEQAKTQMQTKPIQQQRHATTRNVQWPGWLSVL